MRDLSRPRELSFLMPLVCLIAALALLLPASAAAAPNARVSIMDDQLLLDEQDASVVDRHMRRFRSLGVDRLRVSAFWDQIAPKPGQAQQAELRRGIADGAAVPLRQPRPRRAVGRARTGSR